VIIDNIVRRLTATPGHAESVAPEVLWARVRLAVNDVVRPTMFSLLIIIAAYLPIFLLERVEGRIFAPMANTVVAALVGALLFSVTVVPVLATVCYTRAIHHRVSPLLTWMQAIYRPTLSWSLRHPGMILCGSVAALVAAGFVLAH